MNKISLRSLAVGFLISLTSAVTHATPSFSGITQSDFDGLTKDFSGNFVHPSVSGASTLGSIFGLELALVGGQTTSKNIDAIVERTSPGTSTSNLYTGGILAAVSIPFGFTGELIEIPNMTSSGSTVSSTSIALKWTASESLILPFNLAFKGLYTTSKFSFDQSISGVNATVANTNTVTGLQILLSPKLPILEPYVGVGLLNASNTLSVTGTPGTVFDPSVTTGQSATDKQTSTQILAGINVKLLLFSLGAEYSNAFNATRYGVKLGLSF